MHERQRILLFTNDPRTVLLLSYGLGLVGWIWDDLVHAGIIQNESSMNIAHSLMYLAGFLAMAALIPSRPPLALVGGYVALAVGVLLIVVSGMIMMRYSIPLGLACFAAGILALLLIPLCAFWRSWMGADRSEWPAIATAGLAIVLVGAGVDRFWHMANQGSGDMTMNMLLLPGHQIQLAGWLVGLVGAAGALALRGIGRTPSDQAAAS